MKIKNAVIISDTHCGCRMALCPPCGIKLDDGGTYQPSEFQLKLWAAWVEFWGEWVPRATRGEPYVVIMNGDAIDGVHHGATTTISNNIEDQIEIAHQILTPIAESAAVYYHIRGTSAHVGEQGVHEERLAKRLGAKPNASGQFARWDLWLRVGGCLTHILHHIGTTGSMAYEATAVHKELVEEFNEAARWGKEPPNVIVRSHRHRMIQTLVPTDKGEGIAVTTPGWQGKTPLVWRIPGGRICTPQFGGILIRQGDEEFYVRRKCWSVGRSEEE